MKHAITRLSEERRILEDVYRHLLADRDMKRDAPEHHERMLRQTRSEIHDCTAALRVLRALSGEAEPLPLFENLPIQFRREFAHA